MRPSASIVIPAWNEWELTRACLETLRPTLGVRDEVIVVDNGSEDGTAAGLRRYSWAKVVSHETNLGFAAGCNSGASVATRDVVIFLNNDTLLPSRWLDPLLDPFSDPAVGATGPRSNFVSGPQLVNDVGYDPSRMPELNRFARSWRESHRGLTTEVHRLVGFCLAVRRDLLEELGGFDERFGLGGHEDDDLCLRISAAGRTLLIADASFVHHHGHRTFVANGVDWFALQQRNGNVLEQKYGSAAPTGTGSALLSACLIVKDEQDNLGACLDSLSGLVDEVVVYDTGSTDDTVRIAREHGATVIEGYWDDDFGRARNASLAACTGRWVLHVDADEVVEGDAAALRAELAVAPVDALSLQIDNLDDTGGVTFSHNATRLFQRARAHWQGRLHEQVVARDGGAVTNARTDRARIRHTGYTTEVMEQRQKNDRNERVARSGAEATGGKDALALVNLGRALSATGKNDEALDTFVRVRGLTTNRDVLRQALRAGAELLMAAGRPREALEWVEDLRRNSTSSAMADYLEGLARLNLLDTAGALACFERIDQASDEDFTVSQHVLRLRRGLALAASERWDDAAVELLEGVRGRRVTDPVWAPLVEAHWRSGRDLTAVLEVVEDDQLLTVLGQVLNATPAAGDGLAELLWDRQPQDRRLLAFALQAAVRLPLPRVLEWSARVRAAGLEQQCPLVQLVQTPGARALDRVRAAAIVREAFQDERGEHAVGDAAAALSPSEFATALLAVDELSPALLPALVMGATTSRPRSLAMADALRALGAEEQADALLGHVPA